LVTILKILVMSTRLALLGSCAGLLQGTRAIAQTGGDHPAAPSVNAAPEARIDEIVVTAQRVAERPVDVPISLTTLSAQRLETAGVTSTLQLPTVVPGLRMDRIGGFLAPSIRGISTSITAAGGEANVATYIDGVYVGGSYAGTFDLPDISNIVVSKGPQGTLFGRNATGGAILVTTRDPSFTPTGRIYASIGRFSDQTVKGFISGPIIDDKLAGSLSLYERTSDTYYRSVAPNLKLRNIKSALVRGKLLFTPNDDLSFRLTGYRTDSQDPTPACATPFNGISTARAFPGAIVPTEPYDIAQDCNSKLSTTGASLKGTWKSSLGSFNTLIAYNKSKLRELDPSTYAYIPGGINTAYTAIGPDKNFQAEVTLASVKYGGFSYIAGINYYHDNNGLAPLIVINTIPPASTVSLFARQTSTAYAAFSELTYQLSDHLRIVGGLRYSVERREVAGNFIFGRGSFEIPPTGWVKKGHDTSQGLTPRVSLTYNFNPDTNAYFSYTTGFKSASYNTASAATAPVGAISLVDPEKVHAFEVGFKTAPRTWYSFNAAAFLYKYKNQQVATNRPSCAPNGGPCVNLSTISNAASSTMYGVDLEGTIRVNDNWSVHSGASLLSAKYDKFPFAQVNVPAPGNVGNVPRSIDAKDNWLVRAPQFTISGNVTYKKEFEPGTLTLTGDIYHSSKYFFTPANDYQQPAYTTIDAQASWNISQPNVTFSVWGKNLTNNTVIMATFIQATATGYSYLPPRTYGMSVSYDF
jgi:iron complex outermembrane recepter protein